MMFTGIVEETGKVKALQAGSLTVQAGDILKDAQLGGSMAVNGACLTLTRFTDSWFTVDIMPETVRLTNIGKLRVGDMVNLERPVRVGGELGGHLVQGHVDGTGTVAGLTREGDAVLLKVKAGPDILRYVVHKGFIAIDGASLTVIDRQSDSFQVSLVGFTLNHTILGMRKVGDTVNLEVDIIAKYVEQYAGPLKTGITRNMLGEHGFLTG